MNIHFNREESELLEDLIKKRISLLRKSSQNNEKYTIQFEKLLFIISDIAPYNYHYKQVNKLLGCVREEQNIETDNSKKELLIRIKDLLQGYTTD